MKYFICLLFGFFLFSCGDKKSPDARPVQVEVDPDSPRLWIEKNGLAIIEVEHGDNVMDNSTGWPLGDKLSGYTGSGYCTWRGDSDWGLESRPYSEISDSLHVLTFYIEITTAGKYFAKVRNRHTTKDGDNDVWVSVDESGWGKTYDHQENEWTWDERGNWAVYDLKPGIVKVQLAGRSHGFSADCIVLYRTNIPEQFWGDERIEETFKIRGES